MNKTFEQKQLEAKAKQIWVENELEYCLTPVYTDPYDPYGYNVGGVLYAETTNFDGFEFTKTIGRDKVTFIAPDGKTGEFYID